MLVGNVFTGIAQNWLQRGLLAADTRLNRFAVVLFCAFRRLWWWRRPIFSRVGDLVSSFLLCRRCWRRWRARGPRQCLTSHHFLLSRHQVGQLTFRSCGRVAFPVRRHVYDQVFILGRLVNGRDGGRRPWPILLRPLTPTTQAPNQLFPKSEKSGKIWYGSLGIPNTGGRVLLKGDLAKSIYPRLGYTSYKKKHPAATT